ncbi:MAG: phage holin family protein [Anaerolineales bacterium]|nr:phage holin family protein [Anaerolineales bacterium]
MTKLILRWAINAAALFLAIYVLPGIVFNGNPVNIIWLALIFGLINALLRPLLKVLTCPLIVLTLGLFTLLINTLLFWLTSLVAQGLGLGLEILPPIFLNALFGSLIVTAVSVVMSLILKDELKGRRRG